MSELEEYVQKRTARDRRFRGPLTVLLLTGVTVLLAFWTKSLLPDPDPMADSDEPAGQLSDALAALVDESQSDTQRLLAASNVARFGNKAVPELRTLLKSESASKRHLAIMTLGQMYSAAEPALSDLLEMIDWNSPELAVELLHALIRIAPDDERVRDVFRTAVDSELDQIRDVAYEELALRVFLEGSVLIEFLQSDDVTVRVRVISLIPVVPKPVDPERTDSQETVNVVSMLRQLLFHDEAAEVRAAAFRWLDVTNRLTDAERLRVFNGPDLELYPHCVRLSEDPSNTAAIRERAIEVLGDTTMDVGVRDSMRFPLSQDGFQDSRTLPLSVRLIFEEGLSYFDESWPTDVNSLSPLPGEAWKLSLDTLIERFHQPGSSQPTLLLYRQAVAVSHLKRLAKLSHLKVLGFIKCQFPQEFLQQLNSLTGLRVLLIQECDLSDETILKLPEFPALTHLSLRSNPVSTEISPALHRQPKLTHLDVVDTAIPERANDAFDDLPNLRSVLTSP